MNKRHFYLRTFFCLFLFFALYFSSCMIFFFSCQGNEIAQFRKDFSFYVEKIESGDEKNLFSSLNGKEDILLSYYQPLGKEPDYTTYSADFIPLEEILEMDSDTVVFRFDSLLKADTICMYSRSKENRNILFYSKKLSGTYFLAKNLLIYGSVVSYGFLIGCYIYSYFGYKKSLRPLKLQITKLMDITAKNRTIEIEDDLNYLTAVLRDARHRLRKELEVNRISDQKMNFILDSFSEGLIVIDSSYKIVIINKKASQIFSHEKEDIKDRYLDAINAPHDLEVNFSMVIHTNKSISFVEKINTRVYQCDINPIDYSWTRGTTNEKNGASLVLIDITDDYNSSSMKKEFFANASHELKSPLTSVLGYLQLIENHTIQGEENIHMALEKCVYESKRMNKIISDMLTLSQVEKESLRTIEEIDARKAIDSILSSLKAQAELRGIKIEKHYEPLTVKMNPDDFDRIFRNLLDNAIKYNKENGKVMVLIRDSEIEIKDTGIGISKENQSRVFERFFRVDKARSRKNGDTGLGLAIVKHLCNYYDCSITLESSLNVGSSFCVTFPKP